MLIFAVTLFASACRPELVTNPEVSSFNPRVERGSEQPFALEEIARGMAIALGDSALRVAFKERLRKSRYVEHKVMLEDIVAEIESSDAVFESAVSRSLGHSRGELQRLASMLPSIEVYMPLRSQRLRWTGKDEVIVAAAFSERASPIGFSSKGERLVLSLDAPPDMPVIVLTSRETLPADTLPTSLVSSAAAGVGELAVTQCLDMSASIVAEAVPAYYEPPVCDGGWTPPPPPQWPNGAIAPLPARLGIYLQAARIYDNHEPWIRGDPELEFSVELRHAAPVQRSLDNFEQIVPVPGIKMVPTQCSGLHSPDPLRRFNFDGEGGARYTQNVLIIDPQATRVRETIIGFPSRATLLDRDAPLRYPLFVTILERDDGEECPTPAKELVEGGFKVEVEVSFGFDGSLRGLKPKGSAKDLLAALGIYNNNDIIWQWRFDSWEQLRVLNMTMLTSNEADVWLTTSPALRTCVLSGAPLGPFERPCVPGLAIP